MNYEKMSEKLQQILMRAVEICKSYGHANVDTIQLLKAIFEDEVLDGLFKRLNIDKREALALIDEEMNRIARVSNTNPQLTQEVARSFDEAEKWAAQHEETYLSVASVWIALMFNRSYISKQLVKQFHLKEEQCKEEELKRTGRDEDGHTECGKQRGSVEQVRHAIWSRRSRMARSTRSSVVMMRSDGSFRSCRERQRTIRC